MINQYLNFIKQKTIRIDTEEVFPEAIRAHEVAGPTVCTMVSAGTELHACFLDVFNWGYPRKSGYTAVMRIEYKGSDVKDLEIGDLVFCMATHQSYQIQPADSVVKIPDGVSPEDALFCRLAGVSMATISRTSIKPGEKVLVTGLGTVGYMAMSIYSNLGYEVIGVDPDASRREFAKRGGFTEIYESVPFEHYNKQIALALECSGSERAVLDCCNIVRPHGEVSIVGVPWKPYTDTTAYQLTHSIFYNYVKVYSGWEMDLPHENSSQFIHYSMNENYRLALKLIRDGKIRLEGLSHIRPYTEAQQTFEDILEKREPKIATIFTWESVCEKKG